VGTRANWFLGDLAVAEQAPIEELGLPISLDGEPTLRRRLVDLVEQEGYLYQQGTTCSIKDRADTSCSACPVREHDPARPPAALCRVGVEQEQTVTSMAVVQARGPGTASS